MRSSVVTTRLWCSYTKILKTTKEKAELDSLVLVSQAVRLFWYLLNCKPVKTVVWLQDFD